jgi:hypothetical protein
MKQPAQALGTKSLALPPRCLWDFDLDGCPEAEIEHCCFYEYALEHEGLRNAVESFRENRENLLHTEDDPIARIWLDKWFGSKFRVLVDHPEFPKQHWLEIAPGDRKRKIKAFPPYSRFAYPNSTHRYEGPGSLVRLQTEQRSWQAIKKEKNALLDSFLACRSAAARRKLVELVANKYLGRKQAQYWRRKLSTLTGNPLRLEASKVRKACDAAIERRHRQPCEVIVYLVDWHLRPKELVEEFRIWTKVNRVHPPRKRKGGHTTTSEELLKALGAKRLLGFFKANWDSLPKKYRDFTLRDALADYTLSERRAAGRPEKPLYRQRSGWIDALKSADAQLASL